MKSPKSGDHYKIISSTPGPTNTPATKSASTGISGMVIIPGSICHPAEQYGFLGYQRPWPDPTPWHTPNPASCSNPRGLLPPGCSNPVQEVSS